MSMTKKDPRGDMSLKWQGHLCYFEMTRHFVLTSPKSDVGWTMKEFHFTKIFLSFIYSLLSFLLQTYNAKEVHNWKRISDHSNLALFIYCKKKLFFGCVGDFQVNDWWHLIARQKNDPAQCEKIKNLLALEENFVQPNHTLIC